MSNEISWPAKPFYIQSRINGSAYALTPGDNGSVKTKPLVSTIDFLWSAKPDNRGGAFLVHVGTGLCLTANDRSLSLSPLNSGNSAQLFRVEDLGSPWVGINTWNDWEEKINVYGSDLNGTIGLYHWDGGADNEKWLLREEVGSLDVIAITYHTDQAIKNFNDPPTKIAATVVDNSAGAAPVTSTVSLKRTTTRSRSVALSQSDTVGRKYTQTFGAKGGVKDVWEVSASFSFEESSSTTKSITDQTTDTESFEDTTTLNVTVPANKRYRYQIAVYYAKFSIPFTATMRFQSSVPGSQPVDVAVEGVYNGVNAMRSDVEVAEMPAQGAAVTAKAAVVSAIAMPARLKAAPGAAWVQTGAANESAVGDRVARSA